LRSDMACGLVTLGAHDKACGEVCRLPSNTPRRGRDFVEMGCDQLGT